MPTDSDDVFAYIAGFTAGGVPFGVTWDDLELENGPEGRGPEHEEQDV